MINYIQEFCKKVKFMDIASLNLGLVLLLM